MPLPFRTFPFKVPPAGIARPFQDRWLPRRSGWRRVRVRTRRALISLASSRHPRPSGPPSPRRQDCSRATSCAADLGAVAGRGPGLERRFTSAEAPVSSSLAGTSNRAHPRDAPSTSERSSSRVPDALPRYCYRLVGRDLRGVLPLQSLLPAFRCVALTDLHGDSRNRDRARPREALRDGVAPHASGRPFRRARSLGERTTTRPVGGVSVATLTPGRLAATVQSPLDLRPGLAPFAWSSGSFSTWPAPASSPPREGWVRAGCSPGVPASSNFRRASKPTSIPSCLSRLVDRSASPRPRRPT